MLHYIYTLILFPLLIPQGIWVRRKTPVLPEPNGPRQGKTGKGPVLKVLIVGDSSAAGVGVNHQDQALLGCLVNGLKEQFEVHWTLLAETGSTTQDTLTKLQNQKGEQFEVALVCLGVNDVTNRTRYSSWVRLQSKLRAILRDKFNVKLLITSGLPPMHGFPALPQPLRWYLGRRATEFDEHLKSQISGESEAQYLSARFTSDPTFMASDGFHPGEKGYKQWAQNAVDLILRNHTLTVKEKN